MYQKKSITCIFGISSLFLGSVALFDACTGCQQTAPEMPSTLVFDTIAYKQILHVPAIEGSEKPCLNLEVSVVPVSQGPSEEVVSQANAFIAGMLSDYGAKSSDGLEASVKSLIETHESHYKEWVNEEIENYVNDSEAAARWLSGEFTLVGKPVYSDNGLLTYGMSKYENMGNSHGQMEYVYETCTFDKVLNNDVENVVCRPISLEDVVLPDSIDALNAKLENSIVKMFGAESLSELRKNGPLFEKAEIVATDNFYLSDACMTFVYNTYEIATYAAGTIEVSIEWNELIPMMPSDSPLLSVAKQSK